MSVQQLRRDPATGSATLRVRPLHGDTVYMSDTGPATTSSSPLETREFTALALELSFLAVDSSGEHKTGDPVTWHNTIEVRYRLFERKGQPCCQLQAVPRGIIRYTLDGSSPARSGQQYEEPFDVAPGTRVILAEASEGEIRSNVLRIEAPQGQRGGGQTVDPRKLAQWRRRIALDSTAESFGFLTVAEKHKATLGGVALTVAKEAHYADLRIDVGALEIVGAEPEIAQRAFEAQQSVYRALKEQIDEWGIERNEQGWVADAYLYCCETIDPATGWKVPLAPSWVIARRAQRVIARTRARPGRQALRHRDRGKR